MENEHKTSPAGASRREFLKSAAAAGAASVVPANAAAAQASAKNTSRNNPFTGEAIVEQNLKEPNPVVPNFQGTYGTSAAEGQVPMRAMGKTGVQVSILGMGGFHLGTCSQQETTEMVAKALDHGINFFDNAWEYHKGKSEEQVGVALKGKRDRAIVMTKVCTHGRTKGVAMKQLEESLTRLQTDHLDVWQVHEVVYYNDPEKCYMPDGVLEALTAAKQQGKVRFVGFTGHKNPSIHLDMIQRGYPFDTVQMPLNPLDFHYRSFQQNVLPVAAGKGMAVFGMKSMGGSGEMITHGALTPTEALRYAMSLPGVSTTISGMDKMEVLDQNLKIALGFQPLTAEEIAALRKHALQFNDGRYELFKSSVKYDGWVGREQHDYPDAEKLPA